MTIEMSGGYQALHEAVRTAAHSSRVVVSGLPCGSASPVRLGEECHHNRISVGSQISEVSGTVLSPEQQGQLRLIELITHTFPVEDVLAAFEMRDVASEPALQVVLDYGVPR